MKNAQLQHPGIKSQPVQLPMQLTTAPQARMHPTLSLSHPDGACTGQSSFFYLVLMSSLLHACS